MLFCFNLAFWGCSNNDFSETVYAWPNSKLSAHWSLRLPPHHWIKDAEDPIFPHVIAFDTDSMLLKFGFSSVSKEDAALNFAHTLKVVKKETPVGGPCLGGYDGEAEFFPFLDRSHRLSGLIIHFDDHGRKSVSFRVEDLHTGEAVDMSFESLTPGKVKLVDAIINSVQFRR